MENAAIFIGWKEAKVGREGHAGELFETALAYYRGLVDRGVLTSFEPVMLGRHGGELNGFILLRGDRDKLNILRDNDEFVTLTVKATHYLDGFGVVDAYIGDGLIDLMRRWRENIVR